MRGNLIVLTLHIRRLRPTDREVVAAMFAAAYPQRADDLAWRDERVQRWVATDDGRVVGYGSFWPVRDHRFRMDMAVAPELRRRGIGGQLLDVLVGRARAANATTLQARTESDRLQALGFLTRRGFAETMRMERLVLNVAGATLEPYAGVERRLAADGIALTNLADELHRIGDACWHRFCAAYGAARDGWPDPDPDPDDGPAAQPSVAEFRRKYGLAARLLYEEYGRLWQEPCILAVHGEQVVGFAGAIGTGVRPEMRGRGIATAMKLRVIATAREGGVTTLRSSTGNPAMVKVNERLGYRRTTTEVRLVRRLGSRGPVRGPATQPRTSGQDDRLPPA
jgi:GNAT superfamily N-acetyltransferase